MGYSMLLHNYVVFNQNDNKDVMVKRGQCASAQIFRALVAKLMIVSETVRVRK